MGTADTHLLSAHQHLHRPSLYSTLSFTLYLPSLPLQCPPHLCFFLKPPTNTISYYLITIFLPAVIIYIIALFSGSVCFLLSFCLQPGFSPHASLSDQTENQG